MCTLYIIRQISSFIWLSGKGQGYIVEVVGIATLKTGYVEEVSGVYGTNYKIADPKILPGIKFDRVYIQPAPYKILDIHTHTMYPYLI